LYPVKAEAGYEDHSPEEADKMHDAWFKSVVLQVTLWSQPYVKEGIF
jgi:Protoglobin